MLNKTEKTCKTCENTPLKWRRFCLSCIREQEREKAMRKHEEKKMQAKKERADARINMRIDGVSEEERATLREEIEKIIPPYLKRKQITIKVSKWKVKSKKVNKKDKLDKIFSLFIRQRDKACVICWSIENLQNWHLFSRVSLATRWDEVNCNTQCSWCNILHESNPRPYTEWFKREYGELVYEDMETKWHSTFKPTMEWYDDKIEYYNKLTQ